MSTTRVEVDGAAMLLKLGTDKIVHDLADNETICPTCKGVGIHKSESVYGLSEEPRKWDDPFPYKHQWLTPCHHCHMGKILICLLCKGYIERSRTWCECKEARALRDAEAAKKEGERRAKLPRVKLEDYELDMVYCEDHSDYLTTDAIYDHLDDHDDCTFFACTMAKAQIEPDAETVIDEIMRMASEEVEDGEDRVDMKPGGQEALDAALKKWFDEYVEVPDVYWQNSNLIVEIPDAEPVSE
jgi:hypothetical protein